ncbi:MAG: hypothetical protein H8E66_24720 [Planctomycetes bacterium]|nr:hypothetical protein [Planctomycetota bacterium]
MRDLNDVKTRAVNYPATPVWPLVVGVEEFGMSPTVYELKRCYYFWFFGYVAKLPFEHESKFEGEFLDGVRRLNVP